MFLNIEINGESYQVKSSETIIQSCYRVGIEIPRFCYHEKLSIAGNCRMCLVEVAFPKTLKPVASCAMPIVDNMKIFTNTVLVKKARESVLEFLLINHPLDCPICDQGGECDLQDQTMVFGSDRGRFYEAKRAVEDKECGPLIKTVMTRCIHCTRCVRFCSEIAGIEFLGTIGRGSSMEIGTFVERLVDSEISGNVIDLCPVGALMSKPYAFLARPWELRSIETIDVIDSFCSSIRVDVRGSDVMRILPLMNIDVNDEWISDKTRFFYDGLKHQRLHYPMVKFGHIFFNVSWEKALFFVTELIWFFFPIKKINTFFNVNVNVNSNRSSSIVSSVGNLVDVETILVLKGFMNLISSPNLFYNNNIKNNNFDFREDFIFLCKDDIFNNVDAFFLINFNPRLEMPLLNLKIRKSYLLNNILVFSIGQISNLNYFYYHLANNTLGLVKFLEGKHFFCKKFVKLKAPLFLFSSNITERLNGFHYKNIVGSILKYCDDCNSNVFLNMFGLTTSELHCLELGFSNSRTSLVSDLNFFFLYSVNGEFYNSLKLLKRNFFFLYQGHNGDVTTSFSNVILPTSIFVEKSSMWITYKGSLKKTRSILSNIGETRDDWQILMSLILILTEKLKIKVFFYENIDVLRKYLLSIVPLLNKDIYIYICNKGDLGRVKLNNSLFFTKNFNFYMTDSVTRSSRILSLCSQRYFKLRYNFFD